MKADQVIDINIVGSMIEENPDGEPDYVITVVQRVELEFNNEETWTKFIDHISNFPGVIDTRQLS